MSKEKVALMAIMKAVIDFQKRVAKMEKEWKSLQEYLNE